jgi:Zn-dependent protease with chaperone function
VQGGKIRILGGSLTGTEVPVSARVILGRDPAKAQIVFPTEDTAVSREHCEIRFDSAHALFEVRDLGSRNGTFIASGLDPPRRLTPDVAERLAPGQNIMVGSSRNRLVLELDRTIADAGRPARYRPPVARPSLAEQPNYALPALRQNQTLNPRALRDRWENFYLAIIYIFNALVGLALLYILVTADWWIDAIIVAVLGFYSLMFWVSWNLLKVSLWGHSIEVGPDQYPQIYNTVKRAADLLKIPIPQTLICHGHGVFMVFVARYFNRRGLIIITSNMMDEFSKRPSSRELMMFVGRQLGHIKAGHFHLWILKDVIGALTFFFHWAWKRRCHFTADRIGMLVAGELPAAERALSIITVGGGIAPSTNYDEVREQRTRLFESPWSWIKLAFDSYPFMVDRIVRLREFSEAITANAPQDIGTIPVEYFPIRSLPVLIIHGHDQNAVYDLKDFLHSALPHVVPRQMASETFGALSMPEKFESTVMDAEGAIALLTPDDTGAVARREGQLQPRARQNVIMEIGWAWGKLGRERFLLLLRGDVEIPSDLSGVDVHRFVTSPRECSEAVRAFLHRVALP